MCWYKDKRLNNIGRSCDNAIDKFIANHKIENAKLLITKYKQARKLGFKTKSNIYKSRYYYFSFTCLNEYLQIFKKYSDVHEYKYSYFNNRYTSIVKACLQISRQALLSFNKYESNHSFITTEIKYLNGCMYQIATNYALILDETNRTIQSIKILRKCSNFSMSMGNLGIDLYRYSCFTGDINSTQYLLGKSICYLKASCTKCLKKYNHNACEHFYNLYLFLRLKHTHEKLVQNSISKDSCSITELNYRIWSYKNCLFLNVYNDIDYSFNVACDNLNLPPILTKDNVKAIPFIFDVFNSLKQEYVSARYQLYNGFYNLRSKHFSDRGVSITNTHRYIYGYYLEQIKMAFRACYSIFDQIAFILCKYLDLSGNNSQRSISFESFFQNKNIKKLFKKYPNDSALKGLYWIHEDIFSKHIGLDYDLFIARQIRDALEHRCLFFTNDNLGHKHVSKNSYSYIINIQYFKKIALRLMQVCREAIILLTISIRIEEYNKKEIAMFPHVYPTHKNK